MSGPAYDAVDDPACYAGTTVLKNKAGLRDQALLDQFEAAMVEAGLAEPLPAGGFDDQHYRAVHRHLFEGVYAWAGRSRLIRISKGDSTFCYPEWIDRELAKLFFKLAEKGRLKGLSRSDFAREAASFLADLNAIHPFREGNGRTMKAFFALLAEEAGHPIDIGRIKRGPYLKAMIAAFNGDEAPLAAQIDEWLIE